MKLLYIAMFLGVLPSAIQALSLSSILTISIGLISVNLSPVSCFFSLFRRRGRPQALSPVIQEEPTAPNDPVQMPQNLGGSQSFGSFNPFPGFGGGNAFQRFSPIRGFGGGFFGQNPLAPIMPQFFQPPQFQNQHQQFPSQQQVQQQFPNQQQVQQQFPNQQQVQQQFPNQQSMQFQQTQNMQPETNDPFRNQGEDMSPSMNYDEAESFFSLLAETDESKCISRLVCEMGANPDGAGEFGQTISEIIGSLTDFPRGSKVSEYNEVLNIGRNHGIQACISQFALCEEESFQMVKTAQAADAAE